MDNALLVKARKMAADAKGGVERFVEKKEYLIKFISLNEIKFKNKKGKKGTATEIIGNDLLASGEPIRRFWSFGLLNKFLRDSAVIKDSIIYVKYNGLKEGYHNCDFSKVK